MSFPLHISVPMGIVNPMHTCTVILNSGFSVLLGANASGKTHLLRALKRPLKQHCEGKQVRFLSAGRIGMSEQYRSDYDGHRGGNPSFDAARYGTRRDTDRRHQIETIVGDFHTIAVRPDIQLKIRERLRKLFNKDIFLNWDSMGLEISFGELNSTLTYSSAREASGLIHLVAIMAGLYDDEVGALLIDEPEVSLHPQLQAFLLREMLSASGDPKEAQEKKIIVVATHSTEMIRITKPNDLCSLIFCYGLSSELVQIPATAGELQNKELRGLVSRLGQEHKLSLFAKRPLLVEGPSDVIVCDALAARANMHLDAAGSQLLPVIGKGNMPVVVKLLRLMGKQPVVLADADAIADGSDLVTRLVDGDSTADELATRHGHLSASKMFKEIIRDFCRLVSDRWEEISSLAEQHYYWVARIGDDEAQAQRRSALCILLTDDFEKLRKLSPDLAWYNISKRLRTITELLESVGLFILRRGTIESYFLNQIDDKLRGKPGKAIEEAESIASSEQAVLKRAYADVYRCLKFASSSQEIRESELIRDLLLSVLAPIQARCKDDGTEQHDPNSVARLILGDRAILFDISINNSIITVTLNSSILVIPGFPLTVYPHDDVVAKISGLLKGDA